MTSMIKESIPIAEEKERLKNFLKPFNDRIANMRKFNKYLDMFKWLDKEEENHKAYMDKNKEPSEDIGSTTADYSKFEYTQNFVELQIIQAIKEELAEKWMHEHPDINLQSMSGISSENIEKTKLLTDEERDYLKSVLKPFRNEVYCVFKSTSLINKQGEYICAYVGQDVFVSPQFKKGTKYKNMELDKKYTLEELGIKYE